MKQAAENRPSEIPKYNNKALKMGMIFKDKKELEDKYIYGELAIKYLLHIENGDVDYADIAKFLLRAKFDHYAAGNTYKKMFDDTFKNIDPEYDDFGNFLQPFTFDEFGNEYSTPTRSFLIDVATYNDFYSEDFLTDYKQPHNIFWPKILFKEWIETIYSQNHSLESDNGTVNLPDVNEFLKLNKEKEQTIQNIRMQALVGQITRQQDNNLREDAANASFNEQPLTLKLANKAFSRFWGNANPLERDTHPENRDISKWIQEESNHEISKTMADKIAQVIRPEWAATGRKPQI